MQAKFGGSDMASYWASFHLMWEVSWRNKIQFMLMDEVDEGCPNKGCSDSKEMLGLPLGAFVEEYFHLSRIQMFPNPFMCFILFLLLIFLSIR
jgi:hypothetical protein